MQRRKFLQVLGAATVLPSCIQKSYTDFSPPHYDILIKAGEIHDPAHGVHRRAGLGVAEGKIAALADDIPASAGSFGDRSKRSWRHRNRGQECPRHTGSGCEARGLHVTPGLIDLHAHCAFDTSPYTVEADPIAARSSLPTTMSKMMYLGMNFDDVLLRATGNAARIVNRIPMSGTLQEGTPADIALEEDGVNHEDSRQHRNPTQSQKYAIEWGTEYVGPPAEESGVLDAHEGSGRLLIADARAGASP